MALFEHVPQAYFYVKDEHSRFVMVNSRFLENRGLACEAEAWGRTDRDFSPPALAEAYIEEDRRVMRQRRPVIGEVWLVRHISGAPRWYVSSKTPLFDAEDRVIGIAGVMYRITEPADQARYFQELAPVIEHIEKRYADPIDMKAMARLAGLSSTHFNRRFRQLLRITPSRYLHSVRVQVAQGLLTTTDLSVTEIALRTGFYDQSHFTRRFVAITGVSPRAYRHRFRRDTR
jgi:PAS domain S-box-containing protein